MKRWMTLVLMTAVVSLVGCNTVHGLGTDIEKLGDKIQKKAD
jgi:predicted small secreted protein